MTRLRSVTAFLLLFLVLAPSAAVASPDAEWHPSLSSLIHETQKASETSGVLRLVWWIPPSYWEVSFRQNGSMSSEEIQRFIKNVSDYTLVAVVDADIDDKAMTHFRSEDKVVADVVFVDGSGRSIHPLPDSEVSNAFKGVVASMRPVISSLAGNIGEHMAFLVFPSADLKGLPLADPFAKGTFSIVVRGEEFKWHLPLQSLFAPVVCPQCAAECNGSWKFCPWCGAKLPKTEMPKEEASASAAATK